MVSAAKERAGGGESERIHTGNTTTEPVTLTFDWDRLRPQYAWLKASLDNNTASIKGQQLSGGVPVETFDSLPGVLIRVGEVTHNVNGGEDVSTVELEFMVGDRV